MSAVLEIAELRAQLAEREKQMQALLAIAFVSDEICARLGLSRVQFKALAALVRNAPHVVSRDEIHATMYPRAYSQTIDIFPGARQHLAGNNVDVAVSRLRRLLKPHGVAITAVPKLGYRLEAESLAALRKAGWRLLP